MVKHTQTIRRQFADGLFKCVWPFCGIGASKVKKQYIVYLFCQRLLLTLMFSMQHLIFMVSQLKNTQHIFCSWQTFLVLFLHLISNQRKDTYIKSSIYLFFKFSTMEDSWIFVKSTMSSTPLLLTFVLLCQWYVGYGEKHKGCYLFSLWKLTFSLKVTSTK